MVAKEAEAKAILAQLKQKGVKFEDLAKKKSMDNGSKNKGGELGWTDGSNLAKPFAEAMKSLKKGETTKTPVQTQYGWHIIRVDDIRDPTFPAYEEVKEQIARQLIAKQRDDLIDTLRKQATIEYGGAALRRSTGSESCPSFLVRTSSGAAARRVDAQAMRSTLRRLQRCRRRRGPRDSPPPWVASRRLLETRLRGGRPNGHLLLVSPPPGITKHRHPRRLLSPLARMPRHLHCLEHPLGMRHEDRETTIRGGEPRHATR
jgi:hypothetical protein